VSEPTIVSSITVAFKPSRQSYNKGYSNPQQYKGEMGKISTAIFTEAINQDRDQVWHQMNIRNKKGSSGPEIRQ
jgi:hypothetical protein